MDILFVAAEDGICGLEAAIRDTPDLVVCDLQLPDIDGFEVARQLRSTSASTSSIPLVAVTALAMVGDRERVLTAGFDAYLTKPIDPETFVQEIESHLLCRFDSVPHYWPHHTAESMKTARREQRFTILAVDNLPINLYLVVSILTPSGFKVLTANGVSEGLALARQSSCDLIVSDVCMGCESGYDFLIAVRSDPQLSTYSFHPDHLNDDERKRSRARPGAWARTDSFAALSNRKCFWMRSASACVKRAGTDRGDDPDRR